MGVGVLMSNRLIALILVVLTSSQERTKLKFQYLESNSISDKSDEGQDALWRVEMGNPKLSRGNDKNWQRT